MLVVLTEAQMKLRDKYLGYYVAYEALAHRTAFDSLSGAINEKDNSWMCAKDVFEALRKLSARGMTLTGYCCDDRLKSESQGQEASDVAVVFEDKDGNQFWDHIPWGQLHDWESELSHRMFGIKAMSEDEFSLADRSDWDDESWHRFFRRREERLSGKSHGS